MVKYSSSIILSIMVWPQGYRPLLQLFSTVHNGTVLVRYVSPYIKKADHHVHHIKTLMWHTCQILSGVFNVSDERSLCNASWNMSQQSHTIVNLKTQLWLIVSVIPFRLSASQQHVPHKYRSSVTNKFTSCKLCTENWRTICKLNINDNIILS